MTVPRLTRRAVLALPALPVLAACSPAARQLPGNGGGSATSTPSPTPTPWRAAASYKVLSGEIAPQAKRTGVRYLEAALNWAPGEAPLSGLDTLPKISSRLRSDLQGLAGDHVASTVSISYPQYGGLPEDQRSASLIIVATQTFAPSPDLRTQDRQFIVDLRLSRSRAGTWTPTRALVPRLPVPKASTALRTKVLSKPSLKMSDAARADISGGLIYDPLLRVMDSLSDRWQLDVQELKSGHPYYVFGTTTISNHTLGRAVDIWAIDGVPVIDQRRSQWKALMLAAGALRATEIGGPRDLDGIRGKRPYFTNVLHQDHVHIGFDLK